MAKKQTEDFHAKLMKHMEKYLPENERILSGGYNMQNPKWMPKKKAGNDAKPTKAAKPKTKSTTLFGI